MGITMIGLGSFLNLFS
uniref:Uncharacterized protein n=1 Tax=Rhizophora mucronata TaxID=61149 RepID=A0A2P2PEX7_RHIMU